MKNKRIVYLIVVALMTVFCKTLEAKEKDVKSKVIEFLINVGDLNPSNNPSDYYDNVFVFELLKNEKFDKEGIGLFKFGAFADHTKTYILILGDNECEMFNMQKLDAVLLKEIDFLKKNKKSSDKILKYIEATIAIYQKNLKVIPWTE